jgi:hypothetical protein
MNEKLRLSTTPPVLGRAIGVFVGLMFVVVGTVFAVLPLVADGWLRELTGGGGGGSCDGVAGLPPDALPPELRDCAGAVPAGLGPIRFIGLIGIPFALIGLYTIVRVLRAAAWLDGTRLHVRQAFTARQVDLATAEVSIDLVTRRTTHDGHLTIRQIPTLIARDLDAARPVRLPLLLPVAELRALSEAIAAGRAPEGRDRDALLVADQLRAAADHPLGHHPLLESR